MTPVDAIKAANNSSRVKLEATPKHIQKCILLRPRTATLPSVVQSGPRKSSIRPRVSGLGRRHCHFVTVVRPGNDMLADSMALQTGFGDGKLSSFSYFPGARFIIVGLLSRPDSYYKVSRVLRGRSCFTVLVSHTQICAVCFGYSLLTSSRSALVVTSFLISPSSVSQLNVNDLST